MISLRESQKVNRYNQPFRSNMVNDRAKKEADTCMKNGLFDKAAGLYQKYLEANPSDLDAHLNLAKTYNFNNQQKAAIPHLEMYVKANPEDIENITLLGECCKKSGMFSKSIEYFNKALSIEPLYDYAKRNLLDAENLRLQCIDPQRAKKERYDTAVNNLTQAVKIAKNFFPKGYMDEMKDVTVTFDTTAKMGGRSNIAQYEHGKRKVSVTDEYTYASPKLTGAYLIHELGIHAKDNDAYTSVCEEQDAYRAQAHYWTHSVKDVYDPEMDYVADLYSKSSVSLDERVAEIYKLRDPGIPETSYNHPPSGKTSAAHSLSAEGGQPLKAYDIIV